MENQLRATTTSGDAKPVSSVSEITIGQVLDPRGSGKAFRVVDYMSELPYSRDYGDTVNEDFDKDVKSIIKFNTKLIIPDRLMLYVNSSIGSTLPYDYESQCKFLISSAMERICFHSFSIGGYDDVLYTLHCDVNPFMALLCMADNIPAKDMWKIALRDMPSRGGSIETFFHSTYGKSIQLRAVSEMDRKGISAGPAMAISTPEGVHRMAIIDMLSSVVDGEELIILGHDERYELDIDGVIYAQYTHLDSPGSKTATPHYRLYPIYGSIDIGGMILQLPALMYRLLKRRGPHKNVLEALPYPNDVARLLVLRQDLSQLIYYIIRAICNGRPLNFRSPSELRQKAESNLKIIHEEIFRNGLYIKTQYTDNNYGKGWAWKKLYSEMFH